MTANSFTSGFGTVLHWGGYILGGVVAVLLLMVFLFAIVFVAAKVFDLLSNATHSSHVEDNVVDLTYEESQRRRQPPVNR